MIVNVATWQRLPYGYPSSQRICVDSFFSVCVCGGRVFDEDISLQMISSVPADSRYASSCWFLFGDHVLRVIYSICLLYSIYILCGHRLGVV